MLSRLRRLVQGRRPSRPQPAPACPRPPLQAPEEERVVMGLRCRDCDGLPRVAGAGEVVTEPDGARVQIMHNGLRVLADGYCGPWMTRLVTSCRGLHEPQEEWVFHTMLPRLPGDASMIELGGWWSFYSLWFLQHQPGRRAVVLEPDPERRALGEANARRNGLAPEFASGFAGASAAAAQPFRLDSGAGITLPRRSVPELMQAHGIECLDLLHCDIQGAELDVLTGCTGLLAQGRIRTVLVSTHHHSISLDPLTHQRCLALIAACGGRVFAEHDVHESFSGDGLIAARFGADHADWPMIPLSLNRYSTSLFRNPLYDVGA